MDCQSIGTWFVIECALVACGWGRRPIDKAFPQETPDSIALAGLLNSGVDDVAPSRQRLRRPILDEEQVSPLDSTSVVVEEVEESVESVVLRILNVYVGGSESEYLVQ
ncbi:hypothetical protein CCR75_003184 [Bremia lactucae]|uniref:Uncharacterized protein n=1 Tax=Bremia lactucae TaxID=4779 RepID=A0A976IER6_BRELC|nr:hypothetical protein CCR75_003184 [Bremia lactucae]